MLTDLISETINENTADSHLQLALAHAELAGAATSSATRDRLRSVRPAGASL